MSYLDFNNETNSLFVGKGSASKRSQLVITEQNSNYIEYKIDNEFGGIEITEFLTSFEKDGVIGELRFKELLERNNVPYLYVGQGPFGIERSGILIDKTESKRPDFLVNIKDMGTLLFDAKCRNKIGFHNTDETYFSLFTSEIRKLENLQKSILMPVWLAFTERNGISENEKPIFYFISISTIVSYWAGLFDYYNTSNDFEQLTVLRIPNELFTKIEDKIIFEVGHLQIQDSLLKQFALNNIGLNRVLQDKIKDIIRTQKTYKSRVFEEIKKANINYCYPFEINKLIDDMCHNNIIDYQERQPLKLYGE
jgi:hypothetical protein